MALSLLCGGFGVATAADGSVHVEDIASTATSKEVYTAGKVDTLLADYGKKTDVETNKNDIATLNTTTTNQGNQITANTTNIANNTAAIAKKADVTALGEYAKTVDVNTELAKKADAANVYTKTEADTKLADYAKTADVNTALAGKADKATTLAGYGINDAYTKGEVDNALNNKADKATTLAGYGITDAYTKAEVNTAVANAVTTAGNNVDTKLADYAKTTDVYNKAEVDGKITAEANARTAAITAAIAQERNDRDGAINTAINGEVTNRNQAIDNAIAQEVTDRNAAVTNAKAELQAKITAEETARTNADTAFNTRLTTAEGKIGANETAIGELKAKDTELEGKITTLEGSGVKYDTAVKDKITLAGAGGTTITNLKDAALNESSTDAVTGKQLNKTNENLAAEETARTTKDAELEGKITKNSQDITKLKEKDIELEGNIQTNANNIQANADAITATNKRIAGIKRNDATNETTIEGNVTVDNLGNVKAKGDVTADGKLTGKGVDAGAGDITTTGAVNAGSLKVENASQLKGDVTMDKTLSVTGDTKLKKTDVDGTLNVTGESSLKNTKVDGTLITTGKATFKEAVEMDKGLTVTNGATTLKGTTVDGALNVTGESSLKNTQVDGTFSVNKETTLNGTLTAKGEAKFEKNVTIEKDLTVHGKLNVGEIAMENKKTDADGTIHNSSTTITADGITHHGEVKKSGVTTESQFTHTEKGSETYAKKGDTTDWTETRSDVTADGVKTEAKDSKGNRTNTSQTAEGINGSATDKDGNKTYTKVTATENSFQIQDKDGKNKNHQVNTKDSSVTEITNAAGATTKTEQTAKDITNIAEQGTIKNDAKNIENNASENITNTAQNGTITNDAKDIVNNATGDMTNTVGGKLTTTVTGQATENFNGGLDTHVKGTENHTVTGDQSIYVTGKQTNKIDGDQENTIGGDQTTTVTGDISNTAKNITNEATTKLTDKVGANTRVLDGEGITDTVGGSTLKSRVTQKKGSIEAVVTDGTSFNHSRDIANASAKTLTGYNKMNQLLDDLNSSTKTIKNEDGKTTKTEQTALDITNTAKDGTITNDAKDIVNNASGNMTNTVGGDLKTTVAGNELREVTGTKTENVTGKVTENYGNGQETNVTGDQYLHVTGKQTNKIDGDQENIIGGNQTTTVTGDISNKAENITNEANTKLTDKVGDHTRVLDSDGITDTVGGSTFKQRIDKIMMESKDVSIKAEETLTNEAKVITNKASEVINNEAVNINNTATGIITSKASEIKNQADKLISNKVGENTWENMENGKITTSIKDGAKQNLTQSDAAGTTQSTVDGGKSTVTIQNADGLTDAVTDGRNTSVQNQTASAIAADVKDGAGNENASVATATTSANTIKNGTKANTVISTADGTSFINSEAAAPVTGASGAGTHLNTTIKGNTITTGKVTMDYAEVMKDLGVRGNANITGKTTTGSLEVKGESKLTGDVTMESNATVKKDLTVEGNTNLKNTKVDGTLDVTQKANFGDSVSIAKDLSVGGNATIKGDVTASSYKVGDKTYISAAGINANDQKITNVADGSISEGSKDAVNGGQLYTVKNDFEGKVNKVGANAAAMANLHPMEFDPDSKWNIAAAIGNYGSETAAALGAFYRPNDDVMVNLSTAFGTGENMVGGGVSVRLGKGGNKLSREETNALKAQVADLTARMDALLSVLNPNMSKDFPDVPENHWAYEAVSRLAGNDIVQGYPDGEFHGERTMTRYEMAEIIYNALSRGAEAEKELVEEFKPELQAMAASEKATAEKAEG